jgi:hypothetical protein
MFVVSVEGPEYMNKHLWATHKVLGVFNTREEAIIEYSVTPEEPVDPTGINDTDEFDESGDGRTVLILTDVSTGKAERLN